MNLLSAVTPGKNVQYFTGLLIFLQFDKCDVISHLHTATGRNLTGRLPWPSLNNICESWSKTSKQTEKQFVKRNLNKF